MRASTDPPAPLRRVLVATDFSTGSALALRRALLLPLGADTTVELLHVLPEGASASLREEARALLAEQAGAAAAPGAGRPARPVLTRLADGQPFVEIVRHARDAAVDLLVVGRHGRGRLRDHLIGTTAERIVRHGSRPVLVVRGAARRPYARPLVALDLSLGSAHLVDLALGVAGPAAREILALHAYEVPFLGFAARELTDEQVARYRKDARRHAAAELARHLAALGERASRLRRVVRRGDPRGAILAEARRRRADLVVVGTHARGGLVHFLLGSVAQEVIRSAPCDVLASRPPGVSITPP